MAVRPFINTNLLRLALSPGGEVHPDARRILLSLARLRPGDPVDEDAISARLRINPTFVAFVLDAIAESGFLRWRAA